MIRERWARAGARSACLGLLVLALSACAHNPPAVYGEPGTSAAPETPWKPPARVTEAESKVVTAPPDIPKGLMDRLASLTLGDLVDLGLRNSPLTAEAWAQARSAAAAMGSKRGLYYPQVGVGVSVGRSEGPSTTTPPANVFQRTYGPVADLTWLLYDFGGREAAVDETRQALIAADWVHNAAIQNVILGVEQAFYQYVAAKALLSAQQESYKETEANLAAAEARHDAGVATIADVLQARTAAAQSKLVVETLEGQIHTTRGSLATAVGLPADTPYDVSFDPASVAIRATTEAVDGFLQKAVANRPDLAAARAEALKAGAHLKKVRAEGYPSLVADAAAGRFYYDQSSPYSNTYTAQVLLKFPLFTGFSHTYDVRQAEADRDAAKAQLKGIEQVVALQVWSSYYELKTAEQQVATSDDLMKSASQSQDVALGRYQAGVGTIIDLLVAQSSLATARAQQILSRADWYIALAQLTHDTGSLTTADESLHIAAPVTPQAQEGRP